MQIDGALQTAHEELGAGRELVEAVDEGREGEMELGVFAHPICQQRQQSVEQIQDVVQRSRLQRAGTVQVLIEGAERMLSGLPRGAELVKAVLAVEFLDGAELCGVRRVVEVAAVAQLSRAASISSRGNVLADVATSAACISNPQREGKAGALGDEHRENGPIKRGFLGV
jgi:hypothetical protein